MVHTQIAEWPGTRRCTTRSILLPQFGHRFEDERERERGDRLLSNMLGAPIGKENRK